MRNDSMIGKHETIELTLPVNAAYVSAARLTASSISNRMGFNIEDIEDIKAAVSEACIFFIKQCAQTGLQNFRISFTLEDRHLEILLSASGKNLSSTVENQNELGIKMIQALMDTLEIEQKEDTVLIRMLKKKK